MRKIFIADAHLRQPEDANYRRLLSFLATLPGTVDTLYILGDLFEYWIGYPRLVFPQYAPLISQLQQLRAAGSHLVYFEGNHDFNLGPVFTADLQATVYADPAEMIIDGRRLFLCHGDQMNPRDRGYRILRAALRSSVVRLVPRILPPAVVMRLAALLDRTCGAPQELPRRYDPTTIIQTFARARFATGCDAVVTGHFHQPFHQRHAEGEIVSLGDWISQYSYAELVDGVFDLRTFQG